MSGLESREEELRKRKTELIKEKSYENAQDLMTETEKKRVFNDEIKVLSNEEYHKKNLLSLTLSIVYGVLGVSLLALGICFTLNVILSNFIGLGIVFIVLSVIIFITVYPFYIWIRSL